MIGAFFLPFNILRVQSLTNARIMRVAILNLFLFGLLFLNPFSFGQSTLYKPWVSGYPIVLGEPVGPLGATQDYEIQPLLTADLYGNGPYDLFLIDRRVLPFRRFAENGTPIYGPPQTFKSPSKKLVGYISDNDQLYALIYSTGKIRLAKFNRVDKSFNLLQDYSLPMPNKIENFAVMRVDRRQFLAVYTRRIKDQNLDSAKQINTQDDLRGHFNRIELDDAIQSPVRVLEHPHSDEFHAFDGAGIYRGGFSYSKLGSIIFDEDLNQSDSQYPLFAQDYDFLIGNKGLCAVEYPTCRKRGFIGTGELGQFQYINFDETLKLLLEPGVLVSDDQHNAITHLGVFPAAASIKDPLTGNSNLIVGDTGWVWFYPFSEKFTANGAPIYDSPHQVLVEQPYLSLGALPVITSGDLDGDGLIDLVAGNDAGYLLFVRNIGTPGQPDFASPVRIEVDQRPFRLAAGYRGSIQGPMESRWGYTCPVLFDWNQDGLLDIVFNSILGDVTVLLQKSIEGIPTFDRPVVLKCDGLELHLVWRTQPAITQWGDPDGPACLVINDEKNQLRCFWQIDDYHVSRGQVLKLTTGQPIQGHSTRFSGQLGRTKIQTVDWDLDGVIDLIIGTGRSASVPGPGGIPDDTYKGDARQASVLFLRNAGTNQQPVFEYPVPIKFRGQKIELGAHSCSPLAIEMFADQAADDSLKPNSLDDAPTNVSKSNHELSDQQAKQEAHLLENRRLNHLFDRQKQMNLLVAEEDGTVIFYNRQDLSW